MTTVYLAGPIAGCTDAQANDWRAHSERRLKEAGFTVRNPMARDFRGQEMNEGIAKIIVEGDKQDIDDSDILLVYFEHESVGTSMEIIYAWMTNTFVYAVNKKADGRTSPWITYHAQGGVFFSLEEAIDKIIKDHADKATA